MMNTHDNYAQSIFNTTPQLIATPPETSKIAHSDHLADWTARNLRGKLEIKPIT